MLEVITSVHISCIYSETDCFHRPSSHIAHQGFCAASLEIWSDSWSAHQAAHRGIKAGTTRAMPNYAQVGSASSSISIDESAIFIGSRWSWKNFQWHHWSKMAEDENSVPISIGFSTTVIISPCAQCRVWQVCIWKWKYPASEGGVLVTGSWIFGHEPASGLGGLTALFIHWNQAIKYIMKSHISKWIVETVKEAYTRADKRPRGLGHSTWSPGVICIIGL